MIDGATGMVDTLFASTVRHRHVVLILGVLVAGGNAVAVAVAPSVVERMFFPMVFVPFVFVTLALISLLWSRPARFVVDPQLRAFRTPAAAHPVFLSVCLVVLGSAQGGSAMRDSWQGDPWWLDVIFAGLWPVIVALMIAEAWRGRGVQLRPQGVCERHVLGSLTVPWEAAPVARPIPWSAMRPSTLRLTYAEPQLVRRRGLLPSRKALRTDNVDARFLAAAIRYYIGHPEHRSAIGTEEEYQRLLGALPRSRP